MDARLQDAGGGAAPARRGQVWNAPQFIYHPGIACLDSSFRWNDDGGKIVAVAIVNARMRFIIEVRDRASI